MSFGFVPAMWPLLVLTAGLAAALWLDSRRGGRRGRGARAAALVAAAVALAALYLRPAVRGRDVAGEGYLLTEGWRPQEVEALERGVAVFHLPEVEAAPRRSLALADAAALARRRPGLERLRIAGHGLESWELEEIQARVALAWAAPEVAGIRQVTWSRRLDLGNPLVVRGVAAGGGGGVTLELEGPGGVEDAAELGAAGGAFELRAWPRRTGRHLYRLRGDGRPDGTRELDVVVDEPAPLAVLWLESSPSFETREAKRWIGESGRGLALRTSVSRERFRSEFHNLGERELGRLDRELLAAFDLLVADGQSALAWTAAERRAVLEEVEAGGLGLLLLVRGEAREAALAEWAGLGIRRPEDAETISVRVRLPGLEPAPVLELPARELSPGDDAVPLVADVAGRLLAAARPRGGGYVALCLVDGTYRWVLEGAADLHRAYWSGLVTRLARPVAGPARWELPPGPVFEDEPVVAVLAGSAEPPAATLRDGEGGSVELGATADPLDPGRWTVTVWPRGASWHRLGAGEAAVWFRAAPAESWPTLRKARREAVTRARAELGRAARGEAVLGAPPPRPLPATLFLALLLGACGFLWTRPLTK